MTEKLIEKTYLSAKGLLGKVRAVFQQVKEPLAGRRGNPREIKMTDCCMSALAMFKLKYPSMLQFDKGQQEEPIKQNIQNLFRVKRVPCDIYMRERLDELDPREIRPAFLSVFSALQRGKALEKYRFLNGKYLLLSDGTGYFSSEKVHCKNCCEKHHKNGSITYYHQFLGAVLAHPEHKNVIPLCPEPIMKGDGETKNDCERNASERLLRDFRKEHPHLPVILVEDALSSNGPHLKLLKELDIGFITVVKPDGNKSLFDWVNDFNWGKELEKSQGEFTYACKEGKIHKFRFVNQVPINDAHSEFLVNFLEYWVVDTKGKTYHNTWVTDILINKENAYAIAQGGRARWRIENETFNTLKNQGYQFEHNFGHGNKNLSTVLAMLMMLAFLIDESEQMCCKLFQGAFKARHSMKLYLWDRIRRLFSEYIIPSWEILYRAIIAKNDRIFPVLDTT